MGRAWKDRVAEYIDSDRIRQRLKVGDEIACVIDGNYGTYRTKTSLKQKSKASCSCPSDYYPCKHVVALLETYRIHPRSFLDFDREIERKELRGMGRDELLRLIRKMVLASPSSLEALGVRGFGAEEEDGEYE
jgi:uncharacterized Zn finger protein